MNVPADIQARIKSDVAKYVNIAEKHFAHPYRTPAIRYDVRGATAGYALGDHLVRFNPILLMENIEDFMARTVPHEVAHCIDYANQRRQWSMYMPRRGKRSVHGPSWQAVMRVFGVKDIARCHKYDVRNAQVKKKAKYEYTCGCCKKSLFLGPVRHKRQQAYGGYTCGRCGRFNGKLTYVGGVGRVTYKEAHELAAERAAKTEPVTFKIEFPLTGTQVHQFSLNDKPKLPPSLPGTTNLMKAKSIMLAHEGKLTRGDFIRKCVEGGMKATTASTYFNQVKS